MNHRSINDETILRYLLGELSEEEQEPLDLALADDEFHDRVLGLEDDLIDGYVQDRLPALRRARFEERFLARPEQRERVAMARAMHAAVIEHQSQTAAAQAAFAASPASLESLGDETIERYLLDELSLEAQEPIDLALASDQFYERVRDVEEDLFDRYAQDRLDEEQRRRFEERFLRTPAQRERVALARALHQAVLELPMIEENEALPAAAREQSAVRPAIAAPRPSYAERLRTFWARWEPQLGWAMAAAGLLLFAGAAYLFFETRRSTSQEVARLRDQNQQLLANSELQQKRFETEIDRARSESRQKEEEFRRILSGNEKLRQSGSDVASYSERIPYASKGSASEPIDLPTPMRPSRGARSLRIELSFRNPGAPSDFYEAVFASERDASAPIATLRRVKGQRINEQGDIKLTLDFSAAELPRGTYLIRLLESGGGRPILFGTYRLRVEPR